MNPRYSFQTTIEEAKLELDGIPYLCSCELDIEYEWDPRGDPEVGLPPGVEDWHCLDSAVVLDLYDEKIDHTHQRTVLSGTPEFQKLLDAIRGTIETRCYTDAEQFL